MSHQARNTARSLGRAEFNQRRERIRLQEHAGQVCGHDALGTRSEVKLALGDTRRLPKCERPEGKV